MAIAVSERTPRLVFFGVSALLFADSAAVTIVWSASHVGDELGPHARQLNDDVNADARADVARRRRVVPRDVGRDDGGDDAAVLETRLTAA